ncbi:MAG TPA: Rieske (2Fe-2S) protein [Chlorobiota bacterium]|nr:Rieske (2Fe-2S) protein [Chlorobiota bacterium]
MTTKVIDGVLWYAICKSHDVVERRGFRVEFDSEHDVALFRVDGIVRAISNVCPHKRASMMFDGFVDQGTVRCPLHGWTYRICTGENVAGGRNITTYDVREEAGFVWMREPDPLLRFEM